VRGADKFEGSSAQAIFATMVVCVGRTIRTRGGTRAGFQQCQRGSGESAVEDFSGLGFACVARKEWF
jgi:hypothetical protein